MLKVQVYSDLHLEFVKGFYNIKPTSEILILAGDIGILDCNNFEPFLQYISENWKIIIYVLGNHEYYLEWSNYSKTKELYKDLFTKYKNIYLLDNEILNLTVNDEEYCIVGSTLWSTVNQEYAKYLCCLKNINYYDSERNKVIKLPWYIYNSINQYETDYIKNIIRTNIDKKILVVTHYPTISNKAVNTYYKTSEPEMIKLYNNDIELDRLKNNNLVCIAGHTHRSYDFEHNGVRYISNQKGYCENVSKKNKLSVSGEYYLF